jgi:tripartite-type tricarboxylate transporter receptor subunit TctC
MMKKTKRILVFMGLLGIGIMLVQSTDIAGAKDPDYPTKPITLFIAYGVGGTTDMTFRAFGEAASKHLGQPIVYINRAGAGGTLAAMAIMTSKPDGYSIATVTASNMFFAPFSDESPYKDLNGFSFITNIGNYLYPFMVKADAPWKTWKEFIEWAKKNPRAAKIALAGAKSVDSHAFVLTQIEKREQVEFSYIPMKSTAEVLSATLGGHITVCTFSFAPVSAEYLKEGKLRVLTYLGTQKVPDFENVPTTQELYGISIPNLVGIVGPKGLPDYVMNKLNDAFAKAVKDPSFIKFMHQTSTPIVYMDRNEMSKYVQETFSKTGSVIKMLKAEEAKEKEKK